MNGSADPRVRDEDQVPLRLDEGPHSPFTRSCSAGSGSRRDRSTVADQVSSIVDHARLTPSGVLGSDRGSVPASPELPVCPPSDGLREQGTAQTGAGDAVWCRTPWSAPAQATTSSNISARVAA